MKEANSSEFYDMVIIGAGVSGCFMAKEYAEAGLNCLLLEAGKHFEKSTYPKKEIDANSQLYWAGGIELNTRADIGFLRPKAVGGGSIMNQALLDRFDDIALDAFKEESKVKFFTKDLMEPYYQQALNEVALQEIPAQQRNKNAQIFIKGFEKHGYKYAPLKRAQKNCRYEDGNDCIECLAGCRIDSKQAMSITVIPKAIAAGLTLESEFEVLNIKNEKDTVRVTGKDRFGDIKTFKAAKLTMASGAIGNSKLLLSSGFSKINKNIGKRFYTHPQFMTLALYDEVINAQKGAFQSMKSDDPDFRINKFKLENVFAPPVGLAMLLPGFAQEHLKYMKSVTQMACIEVAVRDQNPGTIKVSSSGKLIIDKKLDARDLKSKKKGVDAIHNIFHSTGAKKIIDGNISIGLHLMGGCSIGNSGRKSVIDPDFKMHGAKNIFCADSSIFPNAPGINPSLTIMALSKMASEKILKGIK